jgi:hypothetical protein
MKTLCQNQIRWDYNCREAVSDLEAAICAANRQNELVRESFRADRTFNRR